MMIFLMKFQERDVLTVKIEELEKNIEENTAREAELKKAADQARTLKDEVDILRDAADKVNILSPLFVETNYGDSFIKLSLLRLNLRLQNTKQLSNLIKRNQKKRVMLSDN